MPTLRSFILLIMLPIWLIVIYSIIVQIGWYYEVEPLTNQITPFYRSMGMKESYKYILGELGVSGVIISLMSIFLFLYCTYLCFKSRD